MALLEVRDLVVRFGGVTAVDHVTIAVEPRDFVAIIGPNGAGKTTLFNVIAGAQRPTAGEVRFRGRSTRRLGATRMSHLGVARTFQVARPFGSLTVRENMRLGAAGERVLATPRTLGRRRGVDDARVDAALELVGLESLADAPASTLTVGALRRLELGRALVGRPSLLLLDEPAAGIGADGFRPLATVIRRARDWDVTVLLVEHHVGFALSLCERAIVLDAGRVIADGTPAAIRTDPAVIDAYLGRGRNRPGPAEVSP
jgi:branched-chain amino acid transport system ATP-binding protein